MDPQQDRGGDRNLKLLSSDWNFILNTIRGGDSASWPSCLTLQSHIQSEDCYLSVGIKHIFTQLAQNTKLHYGSIYTHHGYRNLAWEQKRLVALIKKSHTTIHHLSKMTNDTVLVHSRLFGQWVTLTGPYSITDSGCYHTLSDPLTTIITATIRLFSFC